MSSLHAAMAPVAVRNRDVKGTHDRPHRREIFLILRRVLRHRQRPAADTGRRQGRIVRLVDVGRRLAMCATAIRRAWLPPRTVRLTRRRVGWGGGVPGEEGGVWGGGAGRGGSGLFWALSLFLQGLTPTRRIAIRSTTPPSVLPPQPLDLTTLSFNLALLPFEFLDQ